MKHYTGKEWKEKFKRENPRMSLREEPPDWMTIDENGTEVSHDWIWLAIFLIVFALLIVQYLLK